MNVIKTLESLAETERNIQKIRSDLCAPLKTERISAVYTEGMFIFFDNEDFKNKDIRFSFKDGAVVEIGRNNFSDDEADECKKRLEEFLNDN